MCVEIGNLKSVIVCICLSFVVCFDGSLVLALTEVLFEVLWNTAPATYIAHYVQRVLFDLICIVSGRISLFQRLSHCRGLWSSDSLKTCVGDQICSYFHIPAVRCDALTCALYVGCSLDEVLTLVFTE